MPSIGRHEVVPHPVVGIQENAIEDGSCGFLGGTGQCLAEPRWKCFRQFDGAFLDGWFLRERLGIDGFEGFLDSSSAQIALDHAFPQMKKGVGRHASGKFLKLAERDMERAFDPDWLLAERDPGEGFRVGSGELDSGSSRFHPHTTEGFEGRARIDDFGESCKSRLQLAGWNADGVDHWFLVFSGCAEGRGNRSPRPSGRLLLVL